MKYLWLCLFLTLSSTCFAQELTTWKTQPDTVLVYPRQALIRSQVKIQLPAGKSSFLLTGIGASLQSNSVQVSSTGDWKILSVNVERAESDTQQSAALDSLARIDREIRSLEMQIRVTDQQEKILLANASIKGENDGLIPEDFREFMPLFEQKFMEVGKKKLALQEKLVLAQAKRKIWEDPVNIQPRTSEGTSTIRILAEAPRNLTTTLSLAYVVDQASWTPHYTARVQDTNQPLSVIFQADISQQTGMDWNKSVILLSTAKPFLGGIKPEVTPEYLEIQSPRLAYARAPKMALQEESLAAVANDKAPAKAPSPVVLVENMELFRQFTLPGYQRIPHGGLPTRLDVQNFVWQPTYTYAFVPSLATDGFVEAQLPTEDLKNLLSGSLTLFWKGTYLGESYLDTRITDQPPTLSLGRDQSLQARKEEVQDKKSYRTMGQSVRDTQAFRYTLTNLKNQAVKVKVEDQIPVSQDSRIEVTSETSPVGKINAETGLLQWEVTIPAGGSVVLEKTLNIKYPKGLQLQTTRPWR